MQAEIIAPMRCYITNFHCSKPSLITPANQSPKSPNTSGGYLLQATTPFFLQAHNLGIHIATVICENEYN